MLPSNTNVPFLINDKNRATVQGTRISKPYTFEKLLWSTSCIFTHPKALVSPILDMINRDKEGHTLFVFRSYCSPKSFSRVPASCAIKANFVKHKCYFLPQVELGIELLSVPNRAPFLCWIT